MTCGADDMRAYRINARLSDPVIIIIFISMYIYYFFSPFVFRVPPRRVSRNTICPRRPTSGTGRFFIRVQNQIRVPAGRKYRLCGTTAPPPAGTTVLRSSALRPVRRPVPRAIAFSHFIPRAITKLLIKIHRVLVQRPSRHDCVTSIFCYIIWPAIL